MLQLYSFLFITLKIYSLITLEYIYIYSNIIYIYLNVFIFLFILLLGGGLHLTKEFSFLPLKRYLIC